MERGERRGEDDLLTRSGLALFVAHFFVLFSSKEWDVIDFLIMERHNRRTTSNTQEQTKVFNQLPTILATY